MRFSVDLGFWKENFDHFFRNFLGILLEVNRESLSPSTKGIIKPAKPAHRLGLRLPFVLQGFGTWRTQCEKLCSECPRVKIFKRCVALLNSCPDRFAGPLTEQRHQRVCRGGRCLSHQLRQRMLLHTRHIRAGRIVMCRCGDDAQRCIGRGIRAPRPVGVRLAIEKPPARLGGSRHLRIKP